MNYNGFLGGCQQPLPYLIIEGLPVIRAGHVIAARFAFIGPWTLILIGGANLWRIFCAPQLPVTVKRPIVAQPFLLGMLLAAGFETASQLSALILAGQTNAWLLGTFFSCGMLLVDGLDGYLAASTQQLAAIGHVNAKAASRLLGILVVIFSLGLGGAELASMNLDRLALPLGLTLFVMVIGIRVWARSSSRSLASG